MGRYLRVEQKHREGVLRDGVAWVREREFPASVGDEVLFLNQARRHVFARGTVNSVAAFVDLAPTGRGRPADERFLRLTIDLTWGEGSPLALAS